MRTLMHGTITHGRQYMAAEKRGWPTTYYGEDSGAGRAIGARQAEGPVKIGVIGLGVGTLAAYGRAGDTVRIYEINAEVERLARGAFTYLSDTHAKVEVPIGDARLSLERESPQGFDVLAVDAFSSDSIPVHLLTYEAFGVYLKHMRDGGILAVHISNRYLDLEPVVAEAAAGYQWVARSVENEDARDKGVFGSTWILLAQSEKVFAAAKLAEAKPLEPSRKVRRWTDDYSDLYSILK
jgi:spermidine synthase